MMSLAVSDYMLGGEIQSTEYVALVQAGETDTVDDYSIIEPPHPVCEPDDRIDDTPAKEPIISFPNAINIAQDPSPAPAEEHVEEPRKQTYASIVLTIPCIILWLFLYCLLGSVFLLALYHLAFIFNIYSDVTVAAAHCKRPA